MVAWAGILPDPHSEGTVYGFNSSVKNGLELANRRSEVRKRTANTGNRLQSGKRNFMYLYIHYERSRYATREQVCI